MDLQPGDRGGIDDVALLAMPLDHRQEGAHAVHRAEDVHAQQPVPLRRRYVLRRPAIERHAGIVEAEMDAPELGLHQPRGIVDRGAIGNIERQREGAHAERRHLVRRALDPVALDIGHRDMDPFARQRPRDPEPDAVRGTGDERELPGQLLHRPLPR